MRSLKISLLCFFCSLTAFADGSLFYIRGEVLLNNKPAKKNQALKEGDVIVTLSDALAIVSLEGGSKIKINENSRIKLTKPRGHNRRVDLLSGSAFLNVVNKFIRNKTKPTFEVRTRYAAMGVRGTEFFVSYGSSGSKDIWMCVNEGKVLVKAPKEKRPTLVKEGEGVQVKKGVKTSKPRPLAWTKKLNWNLDPSRSEVVNSVSIEAAYADPLDMDYD